jgi:hypothetical protein
MAPCTLFSELNLISIRFKQACQTLSPQLLNDTTFLAPNVTVEWLALLYRNRHVPGSNLDLERAIQKFFVVFVSPSRKIMRQYLKLGHDRFIQHTLQLFIQ